MTPTSPRPELTFRARKILYAVVTEYIATGEPVGSRKLARRYGLNLSPASIRNVLADLEEAGYLLQPHTSAGRIPSVLGFRVFVDALVQMREVSAEDRATVRAHIAALDPDRDDVTREAGRMLASMTGAAAVIASPRPSDEPLEQLRFLPLRPGEVLAVMVTRGGVQNRVVRVKPDFDPGKLDEVHNYLAGMLTGRTLAQLRDTIAEMMATERDSYAELRALSKEVVEGAMSKGEARHGGIVIEGQGALFDRPEFSSVEKIRAFLRTFEERQTLLELLDRTAMAGGIQVLIGAETNLGELDDISVISANYRQGASGTGTVGLIGPTRMDYAKAVPLVGYTAQVISDLLQGHPDRSKDD